MCYNFLSTSKHPDSTLPNLDLYTFSRMREDYCAGITVVNDASSSSREFGLDTGINQGRLEHWSIILTFGQDLEDDPIVIHLPATFTLSQATEDVSPRIGA